MGFLPSLLGSKALQRDAERTRGELIHEVQGAVPMFSTEQKAVFTSYASRFYQSGKVLGEPEWTVERAVAQAYGRVIWVFKAVNTIAGDSSRLPVVVGDKDSRAAQESDVADLLNEGQCNPLEKGKQMRKRLVAQRLLSPHGVFVERSKNNGGRPTRYDLLPPHRTKIIPAEQGDELVSHVEVSRPSGGVYRVEWEDVLWFRDPHPLDPFRGSTPLEAAGMSVELDYFARLYNTSFMRNDGRPGGVLAVRGTGERAGDVSETTLNRLEQRFGKGPAEAGKITAITGDLTYQDFGSTPRDMQYAETAKTARDELLAAFGTPMSVLGYAADRTFDNAGQEKHNYWTVTMPANNEIIETEFAGEVEGQDLWLDTSSIPELQQAEQARLAEAREEVAAGVRSIWSYAQMSGDKDIEETPFTRALYIPAGKTPLPGRAEDAEALGMGPAAGSTPGEDGAPVDAVADGGAPAEITSPADAVAAIEAAPTTGPASPADAVAALEGKVLDTRRAIAAPRPPRSIRVLRVVREGETKESARAAARSEQRSDDAAALEAQLTTALSAVMRDTFTRAEARLAAPKTRKGTRHWQPEFEVDTRVGTKALDAAKAVDDDTVEQDSHKAVEALVLAAAVVAAGNLAQDLTGASPTAAALSAARTAAASVTEWIASTMGDLARGVIATINRHDQEGRTLDEIRAALAAGRMPMLAKVARFAGDAAHTTVVVGRDAAAGAMAGAEPDAMPARSQPLDVRRTWRSKRDDDVRMTHRRADGQEVGPTVPFLVGGSLLRYPRDPAAPLRETAGCRCTVDYSLTDGVDLLPMRPALSNA